MKNLFFRSPILYSITALIFLSSITLYPISIWLEIAFSTSLDAPGYLQKLNWTLQPLFWPVLVLLVDFSWHLFCDAWRTLPTHNVIYTNNAIKKADETYFNEFIKHLTKKRSYGMVLTALDAGCLWKEYEVFGLSSQLCSDKDFHIAYRLSEFPNMTIIDKFQNGLFTLVTYLYQGAVIAYGFLILSQLLLHSISFLNFENTKFANKNNIAIKLNYTDRLREFGLSDLNRAINITYIFISIAMLLPVLSAYWNPNLDFGQIMLCFLLPCIIILPALIPIIERTNRIKEAAERLKKDENKENHELYSKQRLWPFDKTQLSYLGKFAAIVAVGEYIYIIKHDLKIILKAVGF